MVTPQERRAFLDERRAITQQRYDRLHAPTYDEHWSEISPTHRAFLQRLLALTAPDALVVDVGCGTGKYWQMVLATGRRVLGMDQSQGMLAVARRKYPQVHTRVIAMQHLADQPDLHGIADAVVCVDAVENVGPEDWPVVVSGLMTLLRPAAPAYLTVELPDQPLPQPLDPRAVCGELVGEGYHYYPGPEQVRQWLNDTGFEILDQAEGDYYLHLLLRAPEA
ncbi:MAG TPA: class I SAM-dependent methyltransferase [Pseudonocardiaceae bacterium]|nr:class I SAM-dependent methyltransferase [Pseudonocardiaceae bacterium]